MAGGLGTDRPGLGRGWLGRPILLAVSLGFAVFVPLASPEPAAERDLRYRNLGMVDVREIDPSLFVDLVYAGPRNILGKPIYHDQRVCYLRRETALHLRAAHEELKRREPALRFLVYDGLRPRAAQRELWNAVRNTPFRPYVANPARGSMHNYGVAVDLTLCDSTGVALDLGCRYDELGPLAQPRLEERLLRQGKLTAEQVRLRRLLRDVMRRAGFRPLSIEWWHFEDSDRPRVRRTLPMIE